ncbi:MAG: hypothetical protein MZV65_53645 [Chromatiales bacterium]|nr:hypothetical protein [Chromatiales bacterium]
MRLLGRLIGELAARSRTSAACATRSPHGYARTSADARHRGGVPARRPRDAAPSRPSRPTSCSRRCTSAPAGRAFPEFLRAQVEVATPVCRDDRRGARVELGGLRRAVIEEAATLRARADRGVEPPVLADLEAEAHRQGALRRAARGDAGRRAPHDDLRPARARRHRGRRPAHRPDEPAAPTSCRTCSRCRAARRSGKASAPG